VVGGGINGAGIARDAAGRGGVAQRAHFGLWFSGGRVARQ
jgi:hypothetical protein